MKATTERAISPNSIDDINQELVQLFSYSTYSDDITRLSIEMRAAALIHEKYIIQQKLQEIAHDKITWQETTIDLAPQPLTKKGQFIRKAQQELANWKSKLSRLQYTSRKHDVLLDEDLPQKVSKLATQKVLLDHKLKELKTASSKHWIHLKTHFELKMKEHRATYKKTLQELQ